MNNYMELGTRVSERYSDHFSSGYFATSSTEKSFNSGLEKITKYVPAEIKSPSSNYDTTVSSMPPLPKGSNYSEDPVEKMFDYKSPESPKYTKE